MGQVPHREIRACHRDNGHSSMVFPTGLQGRWDQSDQAHDSAVLRHQSGKGHAYRAGQGCCGNLEAGMAGKSQEVWAQRLAIRASRTCLATANQWRSTKSPLSTSPRVPRRAIWFQDREDAAGSGGGAQQGRARGDRARGALRSGEGRTAPLRPGWLRHRTPADPTRWLRAPRAGTTDCLGWHWSPLPARAGAPRHPGQSS